MGQMNHCQRLVACKAKNHIVRRQLARMRQLSADNGVLTAVCKTLQDKNDKNELLLAEYENRIKIISREYESLYNSKSWLYSAPIRKFLNKIIKVMENAKGLTESCRLSLAKVGSSFGMHSDWVLNVNRFQGNIAIVQTAIENSDSYRLYPLRLAEFLANNGFLVLSASLLDNPVTQKDNSSLSNLNIISLLHNELVDKMTGIRPGKNGSLICFLGAPCRAFVTQLPKLRSAGFRIIVDVMRDWEVAHANGQAGWYEKDFEAQAILCADLVFVASMPLKQKFSHLRSDLVCLDYSGVADAGELTAISNRCEQVLSQAMGKLYIRDIYA